MIKEPPNEKVNVTRMIIYSFIPILSIYAGWRIRKFWVLTGIGVLLSFAINIPLELILPFPYHYVSLAITIPISVLVVKHYAIKFNEQFS